MTQTSETPSLGALLHQANELHLAISAALEAVQNDDGPIQPMEWHEISAAAGAANLTASLIEHIIRRQAAADQPIPYTLAPDIEITVSRHVAYGPCGCGGGIHTPSEAIYLSLADGQ